MKRYAIVRVDGNHKPSHFEVERIENIADLKLLDNVVKTYGDTKEQLIRKVATAMKRAVKKVTKKNIFIVCDEEKIPICIFIENVLAKEIVEFLGVE